MLKTFTRSGFWIVPVSWCFVVLIISHSFGLRYSNDSYAYYLLGKNFFSGLGYVTQAIRDFYIPFDYEFYHPSRSFPPMFPIVVGAFDKIFSQGIASSLIANLVILFGIFWIYFLICRKLLDKYIWVLFLVLPFFVLIVTAFKKELIGGRSVPLSMLFVLSVFYMFLEAEFLTRKKALLMGLCLGALYLTRFDALLFCIVLIVYMIFKRTRHMSWLLLSFFGILFPWFLRNVFIFGNVIASDNVLAVLSTHASIIPISWFASGVPLLWDDLGLWFLQRIGYVLHNWVRFIVPVIILMGTIWFSKRFTFSKFKQFFLFTGLWVFSNLAVVSLTPYHDKRYFSVSFFLLMFCTMLVLLSSYMEKKEEVKESFLPNFIVSILSVLVIVFLTKNKIENGDIDEGKAYSAAYQQFKISVPQGELVGSERAEILAYYSKWRTIFLPINCDRVDENFLAWQKKFNVHYVVVPIDSFLTKSDGVSVVGRDGDLVLLSLKEN